MSHIHSGEAILDGRTSIYSVCIELVGEQIWHGSASQHYIFHCEGNDKVLDKDNLRW